MTQRQKSGDALLSAARVRAEERGGPSGYADRLEGGARELVETNRGRTVGGEMIPADDFAEKTLPAILDTLVSPDAVAADASRDRLDMAKAAGSLELSLDTADSIQAGDALERMLAHQMATAHACAMKAAAVMQAQLCHAERTMGSERQAACIEAGRLAGAYSRLTGSFQSGMMTLQRMRTGGRQVVVVQHNHIGEGAQAVVAGSVGGRVPRRKGARG